MRKKRQSYAVRSKKAVRNYSKVFLSLIALLLVFQQMNMVSIFRSIHANAQEILLLVETDSIYEGDEVTLVLFRSTEDAEIIEFTLPDDIAIDIGKTEGSFSGTTELTFDGDNNTVRVSYTEGTSDQSGELYIFCEMAGIYTITATSTSGVSSELDMTVNEATNEEHTEVKEEINEAVTTEESNEDMMIDSDDSSDGELVLGSEDLNKDATVDSDESNGGELALDSDESNEDVTIDSDDSSDEEPASDFEAKSLLNTRATTYGEGKYQSAPPDSNIDMSKLFNIVPGRHSQIDSEFSNVVLITGAAGSQSGGIHSKLKVDLENTFSFSGAMYLGPGDFSATSGADGMAFILHNDDRGVNAIGAGGESLGAYNTRRTSGINAIQNAIALEFDLYHNGGTSDRSDRGLESRPHIAFVEPSKMTGTGSWNGGPLHQNLVYVDDLYSPEWKTIFIEWNPNDTGGGSLSVNLNGYTTEWTTDDYVSYFGSDEVYWGFTGSTGSMRAVQAVAITEISAEPNLKVSKDVYFNHDFNQSYNGKSVEPGSILTYQINAINQSEDSISNIEYIDSLPEHVVYIEGTANLLDGDGNIVESNIDINYNEITNSISYQTEMNLVGYESLSLIFDVKVNDDLEIGTEISNIASVVGSWFTFHTNIVTNTVANIHYEGNLTLVAPENISFGNNLEILPQDTVYPIKEADNDLGVIDTRIDKSSWTLYAELVGELYNEAYDSTLALVYMKDGHESILSSDVKVTIYEHINADSDSFSIFDTWYGDSEGGLYVKARAGQARVGEYTGTIQWTLADTPANE